MATSRALLAGTDGPAPRPGPCQAGGLQGARRCGRRTRPVPGGQGLARRRRARGGDGGCLGFAAGLRHRCQRCCSRRGAPPASPGRRHAPLGRPRPSAPARLLLASVPPASAYGRAAPGHSLFFLRWRKIPPGAEGDAAGAGAGPGSPSRHTRSLPRSDAQSPGPRGSRSAHPAGPLWLPRPAGAALSAQPGPSPARSRSGLPAPFPQQPLCSPPAATRGAQGRAAGVGRARRCPRGRQRTPNRRSARSRQAGSALPAPSAAGCRPAAGPSSGAGAMQPPRAQATAPAAPHRGTLVAGGGTRPASPRGSGRRGEPPRA